MNATDDEVEREHDLHSLEIDYLLLVVIEKYQNVYYHKILPLVSSPRKTGMKLAVLTKSSDHFGSGFSLTEIAKCSNIDHGKNDLTRARRAPSLSPAPAPP